jgi:hypothetical protein
MLHTVTTPARLKPPRFATRLGSHVAQRTRGVLDNQVKEAAQRGECQK